MTSIKAGQRVHIISGVCKGKAGTVEGAARDRGYIYVDLDQPQGYGSGGLFMVARRDVKAVPLAPAHWRHAHSQTTWEQAELASEARHGGRQLTYGLSQRARSHGERLGRVINPRGRGFDGEINPFILAMLADEVMPKYLPEAGLAEIASKRAQGVDASRARLSYINASPAWVEAVFDWPVYRAGMAAEAREAGAQ